MKWLSNSRLKGNFVGLELLNINHIGGLKEAVLDGKSWKLCFANVPSPESMGKYVDEAIASSNEGNIAFAVRYNMTNKRTMLGYS